MRTLGLLAVIASAGCLAHDPAVQDPADWSEDGTTVITDSANGRRVVTETSIEILDNIQFIGDTITIAPASMRTVAAVASTFVGNPSIKRVGVQVNVVPGALGNERALWIAEQRAAVLVDAIVLRGVEAERLEASGNIHGPRDETSFLIIERSSD